MRGVGRNALDLPVAALAALAALFVAFALPGDLLADMVGASGLPSLLAAAEPPLGADRADRDRGRWRACRPSAWSSSCCALLDRSGSTSTESAAPRRVPEDEAPRLRRRDAHPDAPAARPISAARELGEPAPPAPPSAAAPVWLDEAEPVEPRRDRGRARSPPRSRARARARAESSGVEPAPSLSEPRAEPRRSCMDAGCDAAVWPAARRRARSQPQRRSAPPLAHSRSPEGRTNRPAAVEKRDRQPWPEPAAPRAEVRQPRGGAAQALPARRSPSGAVGEWRVLTQASRAFEPLGDPAERGLSSFHVVPDRYSRSQYQTQIV